MMARLVRDQRRQQWQARLEQFESSGLTVAAFCRREQIAPNTFYYWKRQLGDRSGQQRSEAPPAVASNTGSATAATRRFAADAADIPDGSPLVHFAWDCGLRISIPADCLDAIRCVVRQAHRERVEADVATSPVAGFRQVVIG